MLHPEVMAGVSGVAHGHGLHTEVVDLHEGAGHQLLKTGPVPSPLHFAWFHESPFFISLGDSYCNTIDIACNNYCTDDIQWQGYSAINIMQFNLLALLPQNQILMRYTSDFFILLHHPPGAPRSLSKSNPVDRFIFA